MTDRELAEPTGWWEQVPRTLPAEAPWTSAVAFVGLCLGPVVALARNGLGPAWTAVVLVGAVVGGLAARREHRSIGPVAVGGTVLAATLASEGTADRLPLPLVGMLLGVVGAWWLVGRRSVGPEADRSRRMRPPVAALALAGGVLAGLDAIGAALLLVLFAVALALLVLVPVPEQWLGVLDGPIERISRALGAVATLPALALVTLRWGTDRVAGHDPLRPADGDGWSPPVAGTDPTRLHGAQPVAGRWRTRLSAFLALAIIAVPLVYLVLRPDPPPTPPAVAGDPHWPAVYAESNDLTARLRLDPTTLFRLPDYRGEFVNEQDGRRRTWQPPPCNCPRYRVWWFGASAAWGMYQRDGESIASEVAKAAWARGIALEIENRATPGFVVDQEVRAVEAALETEPAPDLIVVLDGANDATMQVDRNAAGRGNDRTGGPDVDRSLGRLSALSDLWADLRRSGLAGRVEDGPTESVPPLPPDQLAGYVADRFRANITSARALAAAHGTRIAFLWQPTVASTPGGTGDAAVTGGAEWAEVMRRTPGRLDGFVTDLSGALSGATGGTPAFLDEVHFSERGADALGTAVADAVLPLLPPASRP